MDSGSAEQQQLRRYLLGELTEAEQAGIENQIFSSKDFFNTLEAVEDDLIDDFARGRMTQAAKATFLQNYATSTERKQRIALAELMARRQSIKVVPPRSMLLRWGVPAAIAAALSIAVIRWGGLLSTAPGVVHTPQGNASNSKVAVTRTPSAPHRVLPLSLSFTLAPGAVRSRGGIRLSLTGKPEVVHLDLLPPAVPLPSTFYVKLRRVGEPPIWSSGPLQQLRTTVPATFLSPGDYILELFSATDVSGRSTLEEYIFQVRN